MEEVRQTCHCVPLSLRDHTATVNVSKGLSYVGRITQIVICVRLQHRVSCAFLSVLHYVISLPYVGIISVYCLDSILSLFVTHVAFK